MMDAKFDLPLLQTLLVYRRSEVVNISVGQIIRFAEEAVIAITLARAYDFLRQIEELLVRIPN